MRRDLDRLAWWWMLLGGATGAAHLGLAVWFLLSGGFDALVGLVVATGFWAPEALIVAVLAGIAALCFLPMVGFVLTGLGILDRRGWALPAVILAFPFLLLSLPPLGVLVAGLTAWTLSDRDLRRRLGAEGAVGWRLSAIGTLNRTAIDEVQVAPGERLALDSLGAGATTVWSGRERVAIVGSDGRQHLIEPTRPVRIGDATVGVDVALVPELNVRRLGWIGLQGSMLWLMTILATSLLVEQGSMLWERIRCPVFGIECPQEAQAENRGMPMTAEYLARLLKKDLAGDEQGPVEKKLERPDAERKTDLYLPAGSEGPITQMGGAAETAPEVVRTPQAEEPVIVPKRKKQRATEVAREGSVPVPAEAPEKADDGTADAANDAPDSDRDPEDAVDAPAEEKEGWGVQDWYDERDERLDNLEIETMIRIAKTRLRIDPNDPTALSILSYYQYLAEDYGSAEATYDKYIQILPEDAAGYNNKALVYKRRGEYQKEEGLYRVALALEPDDVTALNNLGVNLAHQKRFPEALAVMERLEVLDPKDPYADLHRSKIYAEMGKDEEAYRYLDLALQGMQELDTLHHIEFRQDIRIDPSFARLRETARFRSILLKYYGKDTPLPEP